MFVQWYRVTSYVWRSVMYVNVVSLKALVIYDAYNDIRAQE